jgi:hypothetical protein
MLVVTGAFLADRVGIVDGNLCVWGGVLNVVQVDYQKAVFVKLVIVVQRPLEEDRLGSKEEAFTVDIRRPNGSVDRRILRFDPQVPPRPQNGFYWADILFGDAEKGRYNFRVGVGAAPGEEDAIFDALQADEMFQSLIQAETSFEVEVRHDSLDLKALSGDDGDGPDWTADD